jgi:hypothetical protein
MYIRFIRNLLFNTLFYSKMLHFFVCSSPILLGDSVVPERNSILQTAALQHLMTAVPKPGWKGQVFPTRESPRSFSKSGVGRVPSSERYSVL